MCSAESYRTNEQRQKQGTASMLTKSSPTRKAMPITATPPGTVEGAADRPGEKEVEEEKVEEEEEEEEDGEEEGEEKS